MSKEALFRTAGIYSAFCRLVQLFEILQDGFHSPLTKEQIAELFQAGRLNRHTPCKPANKPRWRTIDELFPLLKYHVRWQLAPESPETTDDFGVRRAIMLGAGFVTATAAALIVYFYLQGQSPTDRPVSAIDYMPPSERQLSPPPPVLSAQPAQNTVSRPTTASFSNAGMNQDAVATEELNGQSYIRSAETARIAEQSRREQAQAQQQRRQQEEVARQQRLLEEQKAAGRDHHVPLDQWQIINVGGESLTLKIHDNDTTSFEVWINYGVRHEVKKEKGITHSGTDETLIYSNGRAALYYVWEISGKINHCLLRVRDAKGNCRRSRGRADVINGNVKIGTARQSQCRKKYISGGR